MSLTPRSPHQHASGRPLPLIGMRIAITRAAEQAGEMQAALTTLGAQVCEFPLIEFRTLTGQQHEQLLTVISRLSLYQWVVFTSANAVRFFVAELSLAGYDPTAVQGQILSIGPATADMLVSHGFKVAVVPERHDAEGALAAMLEQGVAGCRVLIPRAAVARNTLPEGLRAAGAQVDVVPVYETAPSLSNGIRLCTALRNKEIDVVTFTSTSTVKHYVQAAGTEAGSLLAGVLVVCIGPVTANTAKTLGVHVDIVPDSYSIQGLISALVTNRTLPRP